MPLQFKKPMLAASLLPSNVECSDANILAAMEKLKYPVLATLKKDGIRALRLGGSLLSRTLKPIPNKSIRERSLVLPGGFDMELWNPELTYDQIESIVMSREHERSDEIQFHVLDWFTQDADLLWYSNRIQRAANLQLTLKGVWCEYPSVCTNAAELMEHFLRFETQNGEGICFRTLSSPYKQGRSTLREQYLVKLCRYVQSEALIIGFEEQCENTNRSKWNAVGKMDRSKSLDGMVGKDTLGSFLLSDAKTGIEYRCGTGDGLTDALRKHIWQNRAKYLGQVCLIKHKPFGAKNKPRSPIYKGMRNKIDII